MDAFVGTILPWPIPYAPQGWAFCNGQSIPVMQNQALYSLIGTLYGGNTTYFNLPNLTGRVPVGAMNMGGAMPNVLQAPLTTDGGSPATMLDASQLPLHSHTIANTTTVSSQGAGTASVTVQIPANNETYDASSASNTPGSTMVLGQGKAGSFPANIYTTKPPNTTLEPFAASGHVDVPLPNVSVTSTCTGQTPAQAYPVPTMPPYLAINYIIALEGIYPMRP